MSKKMTLRDVSMQPLTAFNLIEELQGENESERRILIAYANTLESWRKGYKELEERIEFAIDCLPESPDKAMQFLTPILDKKEKVVKFGCHEARDCFPCDAIMNGCLLLLKMKIYARK